MPTILERRRGATRGWARGLEGRAAPGPILVSAVVCAAIAIGIAVHPGLVFRPRPSPTPGLPRCSEAAPADLLSHHALQCWLEATHGRWRIVSHTSAHGALVVEAAATDLRDTAEIARSLVASVGGRFSEMLIYIEPDPPLDQPTETRRIRWTRRHGFEELRFGGGS